MLARALGSASTPDPDISATRKAAAKGTLRPLRGMSSSLPAGPEWTGMLTGVVMAGATWTASASPLGLLEGNFGILTYKENFVQKLDIYPTS